jgi:4-amino-4-deoxy-L-arabinose transferase-like glycosyltransferase
MMRALRRLTLWPLVAVFAWFAATAGLRPFAVPDEGRYAGVAWRMVTSGDWLVPRLDGLPYFHKPPLFYWITATVMQWTGPVEWAARIAPLLGAMLGAAAVYLFARRWHGERFARLALVALATQMLVFVGAQFANLDMLVAGCITATILAFAHAVLLDPQAAGRKLTLLVAYALCALGVLAKGLIGIVLPGMVIFLWLVWERRWMPMLRLLWLPGIVLFFVIAAPWFVLMQQRFTDFSHYFFVVQHFQRYAQTTFNNPQPFYFYVVVLAVLGLPWTLWLFAARKLQWRGASEHAVMHRLMLVWLAAILLFFSLPKSKLVGYILPVVVPMLYIAVEAAIASGRRRLWLASVTAAVLVCLVAAVAIDVKADRSQATIGRILRERMQPNDIVIALDEYRFAIPFEARLAKPMLVSADWTPGEVQKHDNWRKELADAAAFEPKQDWLIADAQVPQRVCASSTAWLIGYEDLAKKYAWLAQAEKVTSTPHRHLVLWRIDAASPVRSALCPGKPSAS